jgi:transposase
MRQLLDEHVKVYVYSQAVDMRKSYDGLYRLVKSQGIFKGGLFLFLSKNRKRAKLLLWNGKGLMIIMQRMEDGRFADISRRKEISRDELLSFFESGKYIKTLDVAS